MNPVFEEFKKTSTPEPHKEGFVWLTMLIKYDLNGNATVVRSFTKQAKESDIKFIKKEKKKTVEPVMENEGSSSNLFD